MTTPDPLDIDEFRKWPTSPAAWFAHAEQLRGASELFVANNLVVANNLAALFAGR